LKYNGGWSFSEAYNLPIGLREWFVKRLVKQLEDENAAMNGNSGNAPGSQVLSAENAPAPPPQFRSLKKGQG